MTAAQAKVATQSDMEHTLYKMVAIGSAHLGVNITGATPESE